METNELTLRRIKNAWTLSLIYEDPLYVFNESADFKDWLDKEFHISDYYIKPE